MRSMFHSGIVANLRWIFPYVLLEKRIFSYAFAATLISSSCMWLGPQILARIIDQGFVRSMIILYAGVELSKLLMNFISQRSFARFGQNVIERIRGTMISHLMELPVEYYDRSTSGQIMTRVVNDVNSLSDFFQSGMISIVGNLIAILAILIGIFNIHSGLGLWILMFFLPFLFACAHFSNRLKNAYENSRNQLSHFNSMLADFLFGMKTIRSLSLSTVKVEALNRQIRSYSDSQVGMVREFALFNPILSLGTGVMFMVLILKGIPLVESGSLGTGGWVAILSYIFLLQSPLFEIADRWNFFLAGMTGIERIRKVFEESIEQSGHASCPPMESIELRNLSFGYSSTDRVVLKQVNLKIQKGERIGFFGESGMGKTTLFQLLYGFYPPGSGMILWNSQSYSNFSLKSLRAHFGVIEQFPILFTGTIRDNITLFGKLKFDERLLSDQFKNYPTLSRILSRLDDSTGEKGSALSMGERQMVSFLRVLLKNPEIWVLDEATAFFDPEVEGEFHAIMDRLKESITVLQVAHRREALSRMNRHFLVRSGEVLEQSRLKDLQ